MEGQLNDGSTVSENRQLSFSTLLQIPRACRTRSRWVHSKVSTTCRLYGVSFDSACIQRGNGLINH